MELQREIFVEVNWTTAIFSYTDGGGNGGYLINAEIQHTLCTTFGNWAGLTHIITTDIHMDIFLIEFQRIQNKYFACCCLYTSTILMCMFILSAIL